MAKLRPITKQSLTDPKYDVTKHDIEIKEEQRYVVASFFFHTNPEILYFNYWSDKSLASGNGMMDYSIDRESVEYAEKYNMK